MGLCYQQLFRALSYCQQNEEEKEKNSDVTSITNIHNHAILDNSEAVCQWDDTTLMLLLGHPSSGAGEKGSARLLGTKHNNSQHTHPHHICTHTHAQAHMAWRRVDSQRGPDTITSRQQHHCHCGVSHLHLGAEALAPRIVHRINSL